MCLVEGNALERTRQCFRRSGQAITERVGGAFEDKRQAGRAVLDIVKRLRIGPRRIGVVDALDDSPAGLGIDAACGLGAFGALVERIDADVVVGPGEKRFVEISISQRLCHQRQPSASVRRRQISCSDDVRIHEASLSIENCDW